MYELLSDLHKTSRIPKFNCHVSPFKKFQKSRQKKLVKSNKSISRNFLFGFFPITSLSENGKNQKKKFREID